MNAENHSEIWLKPSAALTSFSLSEHWGEELAERTDREERRYGFLVGNVRLLIGRGTPSEIPERADVYPLPGLPLWFRGLLNLRGNLVPVFDVARLLEDREEPAQDQHVLILDQGDAAAGLLIEGYPRAVGGLRALPQLPPVPRALEGHAVEAYADGDRVWVELDHKSFFHSLAD